jgi:hypothetical protein
MGRPAYMKHDDANEATLYCVVTLHRFGLDALRRREIGWDGSTRSLLLLLSAAMGPYNCDNPCGAHLHMKMSHGQTRREWNMTTRSRGHENDFKGLGSF